MKVRFARRSCIDERRDAALGTAFGRTDRDVCAAVPDMDVQIHPARRDPGTFTIDHRCLIGRKRLSDGGNVAVAVHQKCR